MPVILANSDKFYPVSMNDVAIATGGIAKLVESMLSKIHPFWQTRFSNVYVRF